MKLRLRPLFSLVAALAITLTSAIALAGPATDTVKAKQTTLFQLLAEDKPESNKKIAAIFDEMLDYQAIAEAALGAEWKNRSDAEKKEFVGLLKQLVTKAYERNLKKTLGYDIEYLGEEDKGEKRTLVKTRAKSKSDARAEPISIDFLLADKGGGKFQIVDINTEGISLVTSYNTQFTKIIKKDGFPALIQKMKDKTAKGDV